jgi:hypothetical protein
MADAGASVGSNAGTGGDLKLYFCLCVEGKEKGVGPYGGLIIQY